MFTRGAAKVFATIPRAEIKRRPQLRQELARQRRDSAKARKAAEAELQEASFACLERDREPAFAYLKGQQAPQVGG